MGQTKTVTYIIYLINIGNFYNNYSYCSWQETADRWKNKYEEKCHQLDKAEKLYEAAKTTLHRLEKEKRSLDSRLSKYSRGTK